MDIFRANQVISGSHGTLMIDGEVFAEVSEVEIETKIERKEIWLPGGQKAEKIVGASGEGTIKRYKLNSNWFKKFAKLAKGNEVYFELYFQLNDPDVSGAEAIRISGCWNKEGIKFEGKRGEEVTEELKIGYIPTNLQATELI
jgi:phage-like element PBSX protein xkdM|nr:MAG TPA: tail tube protein [Caudoviricetes sp.]DAJ77118.1 MAG TPA: tail tube protein [Bacteriophage sp.]DAU27914.1 MAG TPA: tail tube protein [Caudoviricetes sp.]DAX50188.1 MAG TPA: tail tube protein [Caudoviricetes sp.]